MGTRTVVGTTIMRVFEDSQIPNSVLAGVIKADLDREFNSTDYIIQEVVNAIGVTAERAYSMADKGRYMFGLPSANIRSNTTGFNEAQALLREIVGTTATPQYVRVGSPNYLHLGWELLVSQYGYNSQTNQLSVLTGQRGRPVYLADMQVAVPMAKVNDYKPGVLDVLGVPPNSVGESPNRVMAGIRDSTLLTISPSQSARKGTPFFADPNATEEYLTVSTAEIMTADGIDSNGSYKKGDVRVNSFNIPMPTVANDKADYCQVQYWLDDVLYWWSYQLGSGTYPELDSISDKGEEVSGRFYPFCYWRYDKVSTITDKTTQEYKDCKKLADKFRLDYDQLGESIDSNPDIKDVIQAFSMMGVPPDSTNPMELEYLFQFFDNLYAMGGADQTQLPGLANIRDRIHKMDVISDGRNRFIINIQDERMHMVFSATSIEKRGRGGTIGLVGSHTGTTEQRDYVFEYLNQDDGVIYPITRKYPVHIYRRQETEHLYTEITVSELEMQYFIDGVKHTTSDEIKNILLVPLDKAITSRMQLLDREKLYARSLHFVFNSMQVVKTKWYESGIFKIALMVVAIVIAFWFPPAGAAAAAASAGMSLATYIILSAMVDAAIGTLVSQLVQVIGQNLGSKLGALLATVTAAVAIIYGARTGSFSGWSKDLLTVSNNLLSSSMQARMMELGKQYEAFQESVAQSLETLGDAQDLINSSNHMSPLYLAGEKPTDFYNRTIHSGNIGTLAYDQIHSFVDNSLKLPDINETLRGTFHGIY